MSGSNAPAIVTSNAGFCGEGVRTVLGLLLPDAGPRLASEGSTSPVSSESSEVVASGSVRRWMLWRRPRDSCRRCRASSRARSAGDAIVLARPAGVSTVPSMLGRFR